MKIRLSQLKTIIREEVSRVVAESATTDRRALEYFVKDCSAGAGLPYPTFERLTNSRNMAELMSPRYLGRRPTPQDLELLRQVWEEGKMKYGPRRSRVD